MNRHQKKVLSLAAAIANLSFSAAVAGVATYAWFYGQANATVQSASVSITAVENNLGLQYEILKYSDDAKAGVSYSDPAYFFLPEYDDYITDRNIYANVILRAEVGFGSLDTSEKELRVDITKLANSFKTGSEINSYTSNVIQFKSTVYSYVDSSDVNHVNEPSIIEVKSTYKSVADAKYETARLYFADRDTPTTYVAIRNGEVMRGSSNTITITPDLSGKGVIKSAVIYIECSYHEYLVDKYLDSHSGSIETSHALTGDINKISFRIDDFTNGESATGKYKRVTSTANLMDGKYLPTYETGKEVMDGRKANVAVSNIGTNAGINVNNNGLDVTDQINTTDASIMSNDDIDSAAFEFDHTNKTFKSASGYYIGNNTGTNGVKAETSHTNYHHNISFSGDNANVEAAAGTNHYTLQYNKNSDVKKFAYYGTAQQSVQLYRYYENATTFSTLQSIALTATPAGSNATFYTDQTFSLKGVEITATYLNADGTTSNVVVTNSCSYSYNSSPLVPGVTVLQNAVPSMTVVVNYSEGGIDATPVNYTVSVVQKTVTSISVSHNPTKTYYYDSESFQIAGLVINGTYNDSTDAGDVTSTCTLKIGGTTITNGTSLAYSTFGEGAKTVTVSKANCSDVSFTINIVRYHLSITSSVTVEKTQSTTISYTTNGAISWEVLTGGTATITHPGTTAYSSATLADSTSTITITGTGAGTCTLRAKLTSHTSTYADCTVTVVGVAVGTITYANCDITTDTSGLASETAKSYAITDNAATIPVLWGAGCYKESSPSVFRIIKNSYLKSATGSAVKVLRIIIDSYTSSLYCTVKANGDTVSGTTTTGGTGYNHVFEINSTTWSIESLAGYQRCYSITFEIDESTLTTYDVSFSAGAGTGSMATVQASGSYTLPASTFTPPSGKLFKHWSDGTNTYAAGATYNVTADVTFTAIYDTKYSVTYNANGGTGSLPATATDYVNGATVTVLGNTGPLTRSHYTFAGWNTESNGTGTNYVADDTFTISSNVILYAKWTEDAKYSVTYNSNGATSGSVPSDANTYYQGTSVTVKGNTGSLAKTGFTFVGWTINSDGSGTVYGPSPLTTSYTIGSANVTFYAKWQANSGYNITFDGNTGTCNIASETGTSVTLPSWSGTKPSNNATFVGWTQGTITNSSYLTAGTTVNNISSDTTFYARWQYTDTLNKALTGVDDSAYTAWSNKSSNSPAVYAGLSGGPKGKQTGAGSIQLKSKDNTSGIITTTSGGYITSVSVTWHSATDNARVLNVYGKTTAYSAASDLYGGSAGTLVGSITKSSNTPVTISNSTYTYLGLRSNSGAMYINSITIVWIV